MLALFAGGASAQPPKCWKNADGVTECGTKPPPGVETKDVRTPRPATGDTVTGDDEPDLAALDDPTATLDPQTRQRLLIRQRQCELAREVLRTYETADELFDTDEDGNRIPLDAAAQAQAVEEARQAVTDLCESGS
jgi:hypothetical protein